MTLKKQLTSVGVMFLYFMALLLDTQAFHYGLITVQK